jgi:hypothetical protein
MLVALVALLLLLLQLLLLLLLLFLLLISVAFLDFFEFFLDLPAGWTLSVALASLVFLFFEGEALKSIFGHNAVNLCHSRQSPISAFRINFLSPLRVRQRYEY